MRFYPMKGFCPTAEDYQRLASAFIPFGYGAMVGREKAKNGYRKYVEPMQPVEFGIEKAAEQRQEEVSE